MSHPDRMSYKLHYGLQAQLSLQMDRRDHVQHMPLNKISKTSKKECKMNFGAGHKRFDCNDYDNAPFRRSQAQCASSCCLSGLIVALFVAFNFRLSINSDKN